MMIATTEYVAEIEAWRQEIELPMRRDWVSLVGLAELQPGLNRIGADPTSAVVLPSGAAPDHVGVFHFDAGRVTLAVAPGVAVQVNGVPVEGEIELRADMQGTPDLVTLNTLTWFVIQRGPRTMIRVRDSASPRLHAFGGRRWFPINAAYRVEAVFMPYDPPKPMEIANILGDTSAQESPGALRFSLGGQEYTLDAARAYNGGLSLHFCDATNGHETYGGGRVLLAPAPEQNLVTLDFNRTTHLPCVFTEFATCPIPPRQNRLDLRIEAGERLPVFTDAS